jgi:hypothetical protein
MATVADILTSARYQLHDTDQNKWTGAELLDYVNRGYRLLWSRLTQLNSDFNSKSKLYEITGGVDTYTLPDDFWAVKFMKLDGEEKPLSQVDYSTIKSTTATFDEDGDPILDSDDAYVLQSSIVGTGTPDSYSIHENQFFLRPIPDATVNLLMVYFYKPTDLDSDTTTPFNGIADEAFIVFICEMALAREEHNTARMQSALSSLLRMADVFFKRRDKTLKRIGAYRWDYQDL